MPIPPLRSALVYSDGGSDLDITLSLRDRMLCARLLASLWVILTDVMPERIDVCWYGLWLWGT